MDRAAMESITNHDNLAAVEAALAGVLGAGRELGSGSAYLYAMRRGTRSGIRFREAPYLFASQEDRTFRLEYFPIV